MTPTSRKIAVASLVIIALSFVSIVPLRLIDSGVSVKKTETRGESPDTAVRVAVFNGCGRPGLAGMFAEILRNKGFDVVNGLGANADSFDYDVSVVVERAAAARRDAKNVADALGVKRILHQHTDNPYIVEDVALILGRDWNTLLANQKGEND